jgi:hypothetical protein
MLGIKDIDAKITRKAPGKRQEYEDDHNRTLARISDWVALTRIR